VTDLTGLRASLDGELFTPESPGYDAVRLPADTRYHDVRPALVVRCASDDDVVRGIRFAREAGMHVVPRGGGHCFAGRSSTTGMVLDLGGLAGISVSADGLATIGAGARLSQVYAALHEHGRTIPAGCGPTVGIAGLTLGGGLGLIGRRYGLTCDRLTGARAVLADGRVLDCDRNRAPDLFWALRGAGGGQFCVVTSLVFDTVPEPVTTRFELRWPEAAVTRVIAAWQGWAPDAPDDVTADLTVVAEPGAPLRAVVFGAACREEVPTVDALRELTAAVGTEPEPDVRGGLPYHDLKNTFADLDPREEPTATPRIRSELFSRPLRPGTIEALVAALGDEPAERRQLNFTAMGGAYNRVDAAATAFAHRSERFLLEHVGGAASRWIDRSWAIAHTDGSGRVYPNFPDPRLDDAAAAYHGGNHRRLVEVKAAYDPDGLFRFPQSV
jgi:FAD/FMN-containing dehydrogenase